MKNVTLILHPTSTIKNFRFACLAKQNELNVISQHTLLFKSNLSCLEKKFNSYRKQIMIELLDADDESKYRFKRELCIFNHF